MLLFEGHPWSKMRRSGFFALFGRFLILKHIITLQSKSLIDQFTHSQLEGKSPWWRCCSCSCSRVGRDRVMFSHTSADMGGSIWGKGLVQGLEWVPKLKPFPPRVYFTNIVFLSWMILWKFNNRCWTKMIICVWLKADINMIKYVLCHEKDVMNSDFNRKWCAPHTHEHPSVFNQKHLRCVPVGADPSGRCRMRHLRSFLFLQQPNHLVASTDAPSQKKTKRWQEPIKDIGLTCGRGDEEMAWRPGYERPPTPAPSPQSTSVCTRRTCGTSAFGSFPAGARAGSSGDWGLVGSGHVWLRWWRWGGHDTSDRHHCGDVASRSSENHCEKTQWKWKSAKKSQTTNQNRKTTIVVHCAFRSSQNHGNIRYIETYSFKALRVSPTGWLCISRTNFEK